MEPFEAIVLAGGGGRRLGGADKASLGLRGTTLLDRALRAVAGATAITVVGPPREVPVGVRVLSEDPPGSGPAAAVAAALPLVETDLVTVLACDMPFVDAAAVALLIDGVGSHDAALLVDASGRRQYLAAVYRTAALIRTVEQLETVEGAAMHSLVEHLTVIEISADPKVTLDIDTWDDVEQSRQILEER